MEHGQFLINVHANFIKVTLIGAFNFEGMENYVNAMKEQISQLTSKHINIIINHHKFDGAVPAALALLNEYNAWLNTYKYVNKAFVGTKPMYKHMVENKMDAVDQRRIRFFETEQEAIAWFG